MLAKINCYGICWQVKVLRGFVRVMEKGRTLDIKSKLRGLWVKMRGFGDFLKRFFIMIDITFLISHCFFKIEIVVTFLLFSVTTSKNQDLANPLFLFRALFSINPFNIRHPFSSIKASIFIIFAHFLLLSTHLHSHSPLKSLRSTPTKNKINHFNKINPQQIKKSQAHSYQKSKTLPL